MFRAQFAILVAGGKDFADAAAAVVDEVERGGGGAHEGTFDAVDGGAVFVAQVAVDAAAVRVFVEVVVAARDPSAGQAAADFGDDAGVWMMVVTGCSQVAMVCRMSRMRVPSVFCHISAGRLWMTVSRLVWYSSASTSRTWPGLRARLSRSSWFWVMVFSWLWVDGKWLGSFVLWVGSCSLPCLSRGGGCCRCAAILLPSPQPFPHGHYCPE